MADQIFPHFKKRMADGAIDLDGNDYWVLSKILEKYKPRVIVAEANVRFEPYESMVMKYNPEWVWNGGDWYGASPYAFKKLVNSHNYTIVRISEDDMFIIHNDYLHEDDKNREWIEIYPRSNVGLYGGHRGPGNEMILTVNMNTWMEI